MIEIYAPELIRFLAVVFLVCGSVGYILIVVFGYTPLARSKITKIGMVLLLIASGVFVLFLFALIFVRQPS